MSGDALTGLTTLRQTQELHIYTTVQWRGYIRNLNTDFEPTVHTYDQIEIEGNTALVKGYALTGTDGVTVQGLKYLTKARHITMRRL